MIASKIISELEKLIPLSKQESWDKGGLQIGDLNTEVKHLYITLDINLESVQEAISKGCEMIISHHPMLLDSFDNYDFNEPMGQLIKMVVENNLVIYSAHTSLDQTYLNDWLLECFEGVKKIPFEHPYLVKGELQESLSIDHFAKMTKESLGLSYVKYTNNKEKIKSFIICGGSGYDFINDTLNQADIFLTGDVKYHQAKYAIDHNIAIMDIHHHSEVIMVQKLKELLVTIQLDIEIVTGQSKDYFTYL